ncbi:MAG: hypothetical protein HKL95_06360 [Phycisphaerae bacterium]|nr:hypothetical protein [Phycisphaerae bacterium]
MILLLVIAILVLLALLGTAYILMARADKHSTYAANAAANLNLAQKGVLNMVRNTMLNQTLDGSSSMLGANYGYYSSGISYPVGAVVEMAPNFSTTYATTYYKCITATSNNPPPGADWQQISAARCYDYPQQTAYYASGSNAAGTLVWSSAAPYSVYEAVNNDPTTPPATAASGSTSVPVWQPVQGEDFLVEDLPMEPNTDYLVGQTAMLYTTANASRQICQTAGATGAGPITVAPTSPTTWTAAPTGSAQENMFSNLTPANSSGQLQYDPSDGQYDIAPLASNPAYASVVQPSVVANNTLNPGSSGSSYPYGSRDAIWEMLPYSSPNGTRYRFAVRIIDTNSMLNLNAGSAGGITNTSGQYFNGMQLEGAMATADVSAGYTPYIINGNSGSANGRAGTASALDTPGTNFLAAWANELFTYQVPQTSGVQWYSLATELELRSYGNSGGGFNGGTPYNGRPLQLWPNTLGYSTTSPYLAAANRAFYTTYSWDRSFRRIGDINVIGMPLTLNNAYTCSSPAGTAGEQVWPTFPQKVWVNEPSVATSSANMANTTAKTATDLARVMLSCGYSGPEAVAFAANYMNYMYDAGTESGTSPNFTYTPSANGPSFIDSSGICVRGGTDTNFLTGGGDLTSALATGFTLPSGITQSNLLVAGYAAQPFIVEAAVSATVSGTTVTYNGCAVELYNPYGTALEIGGWQIGVLNSTGTGYNTTYTIPVGTIIPASGYLAIESGAATPAFAFEGSPPTGQILAATAATLAFTSTAATACDAVLLRPFVTRAGAAGYLPVDEFNVAAFEAVAAAGDYYLSRYADTYIANDPWGCANASETAVETSAPATPPPASSGTLPAVPLYDRFADQSDPLNTAIATIGELPGYAPGTEPVATSASAVPNTPEQFIGAPLPLLNIADFNRITRLISVSALSGSVYVPIQMISATIANLAAAQTPTVTDPQDATNHYLAYEPYARFDFLQPTNAAPPDPRALDVLKMITMTNPACDPDLNQNSTTLDAIRMAGRLNVNTASLAALENLFVSVGNSTNAYALASLIVDCRDRIGAFINSTGTNNPGSGICSLGQLLYALNDSSTSATTMDNRDWQWATVYNMCTVRSDTFVVYGLIQALHLNGSYVAPSGDTTINTTDWYTANQGTVITSGTTGTQNSISTDPDNTNAEFILEGQRRFVGIIDRSYCNVGPSTAGFQLPKVVAVKVLPN